MSKLRSLILGVLALTLLTAPAAQAKVKKVPLIRLQSGTTTIVPDPGLVSALQTLKVTPTVLAPGVTVDTGGWAFPIVTGTLAGKKPNAGEVRHFGGLRLSAADGSHVDLNNFRIDDGKKAIVTTQIGSGPRITLATLDLQDSLIKVTRKTFILTQVGLVLSPVAANALNTQFATSAFTAGQLIGEATVNAKIKVKLKKV